MKLNDDNKCRFCKIASGAYFKSKIDNPILQTDSYIVIPSIGAFITGWAMIVPKEHSLNLSDHYLSDEFNELFLSVKLLMEQKFGSVIVFEHGSVNENSVMGCGVDHSHLHIVPFKQSISAEAPFKNEDWIPCNMSDIKGIVGDREYLFFRDVGSSENTPNAGLLNIPKKTESQFFRKILASKVGLEHISDYKRFDFYDNTVLTSSILSEVLYG